jgi:hypothetical protein
MDIADSNQTSSAAAPEEFRGEKSVLEVQVDVIVPQSATLSNEIASKSIEMKPVTPVRKEENTANIEIPRKIVMNVVQTPLKFNSVNTSIPSGSIPRGSKRHGCRNVTVYERGDVIGQGTYGTVFKAKDPVTGKPVAIKKLNFMVRMMMT